MNALQQVPRNALVWIVISLFALLAPHVTRVPIWVVIIYVLAVVWRLQVHRGRWSFPGRAVKSTLILSSFVGILASYGTLIGLEPTVALLLTAFAFKFIELSRRKDAYVLLFLGYFVCITEFLFSQDLLITLYSVLCVVLVTTALVALHRPAEHDFNRRSMRVATVMLLQALPLMVVLFFLFPRFAPLWTVPINSHAGKTGMSDMMKPGDVAKLSRSGDVAFRVKFDGDIPANADLYWRGLVFSRMQQGVWSAVTYYDVPVDEQRATKVVTNGSPLRYSIIMEPTQQNWLYGLDYAKSKTPGVMHSADFRLFLPSPIEVDYMYEVDTWADFSADLQLSSWRYKTETQLPPAGNAKTRELAQRLRAQAGSDTAYIDLVLDKFNTEDYVYTLEPGTLADGNRIDQFMFQTLRGFCEHYASAFVFMMRAAGVPARVVAGYQGGEINPVNKTVIVHQFDAHAWAEVWIEGTGWVRVDPTGSVAPQRIELGLEAAMASEGSFLSADPLSPLRYRNVPLLNQIRLRYDAWTYRWQSWVVGFDSNRQLDLLRSVFGEISARAFIVVFLGSWALVLIPVAISLLLRRDTHPTTIADKHYRIFCRRAARAGLRRRVDETASQFALRAAAAAPALAQVIQQITVLYEQLAYQDDALPTGNRVALQRQFIRAVAAFKPRKRFFGSNSNTPMKSMGTPLNQ